MSLRLSSLTREFVKTRVRKVVGGEDQDPTGDTVEFAFKDVTVDAEPEAGDWVAGVWESSTDGSLHWAKCLVGPGGTATLTDGSYFVWVRINGATEIPVRKIGKVVVT